MSEKPAAEVDYDGQHGPIVRVTVNGITVAVYLFGETAVVVSADGCYGLEVTGPWYQFRDQASQLYCQEIQVRAEALKRENDQLRAELAKVEAVKRRAIAWWIAKRPQGWTEDDHLRNAVVNACETENSKELALAISAFLKGDAPL